MEGHQYLAGIAEAAIQGLNLSSFPIKVLYDRHSSLSTTVTFLGQKKVNNKKICSIPNCIKLYQTNTAKILLSHIGPTWCSNIVTGPTWFSNMVTGHTWCSNMVTGHTWYSNMVTGHTWCSNIVTCPTWFSNLVTGHKWFSNMVTCPMWFIKMVTGPT